MHGHLDPESSHSPTRHVFQADALDWLDRHPANPESSVITSLPDVSELPHLGFAGWRAWFADAARRVLVWLPPTGVAIFYQSDVRHQGGWVDKAHLVLSAADSVDATLVWHKIVCRKAPGTITHGRASYSHLLCLSMSARAPVRHPSPDVLVEPQLLPWSNAMGIEACRAACRFLQKETATRIVVDPFCGRGTALSIANTFGFESIGIDRSARACRAARRLHIAKPEPVTHDGEADARR